MQFFKDIRPEVFVYKPVLRRDKQTQKRLWLFNLIVTLNADYILSCGDQISAAAQYILTLENAAYDVYLDATVPGCGVKFFALAESKTPSIELASVDIKGLRLVRQKNIAELWFLFENEIEQPPGLHDWVKKFGFQRVFAEFSPQLDLGLETPAAPNAEASAAAPPATAEKRDGKSKRRDKT